MEQEAVTVAAKHERGVESIAVGESLLHAVAKAVVIVLGFDDGYRHVLLVAQNVIRAPPFAPSMQPATHNDAARSERNLFAHLAVHVPASLLQSWINELTADVPLCELFLVHMLSFGTSGLQLLEITSFCSFRIA